MGAMLRNALIVLLALVAVATLVECNGSKGIFNDYLKRPKMANASYYHRQNRKWLQSLAVEAESSPELVLQQLQEARVRAASGFERENYERLISLSDGGSECRSDVVDLVISIYAQLELPQQKPLERYLDHFVRQKFRHCSMTVNKLIEQQRPSACELEIDRFFKQRLHLTNESTDFQVYKAIRESSMRFQLTYDQCSDLGQQFGNVLNIMNLAFAVGLQTDYDARALKLNEYNRFCPSQMIKGDY